MPKSTFKPNALILDLLYQYMEGEIEEEELSEQVEALAYYQNDLRSREDDYNAGLV